MDMPISMPVPGPSANDLLRNQSGVAKVKSGYGFTPEQTKARAKQASEDFEAVFLNNMFQQMFTGLQGEGPFGGNGATGVWRSFLTDEYAKSFAKSGGIGIASQVYSTLLAQQEIRQ
ncbi:MAG: flagellar assembly peptidoglycan hydrolase FlgJ [Pseudomonadota bacterium]|nr:flagellar assembly peptidoglycan hydrolase FlgJ [Pseudomonadota bacterium]